MVLSRFLKSAKIPVQRIPLAFGKYRETHGAREESVVVPCLVASAVLVACIIGLGVVGDKRIATQREDSK